MRTGRTSRFAVAAALAGLAACSASPRPATSASGSATPSHRMTSPGTASPGHAAFACRGATTRHYSHVVWIWMENRPYSSVLGTGGDAPRTADYARRCGLATNYSAVAHGSLPNYLAATSGAPGVPGDCEPDACPQHRPSLFGQLDAAGLQWRAYAEGMAHPCDRVSHDRYAARHNPAVYFTPVSARCAVWDVRFDDPAYGFARALADRALPSFAFVTPDLCDDGHDCTTAHADAWLGKWLDRIVTSPAYAAGDTAVFVTWDEGESGDEHVVTIVIAPSVRAGARSATAYTHYSLLRTTEELLGLPLLGAASAAHSMRAAFDL